MARQKWRQYPKERGHDPMLEESAGDSRSFPLGVVSFSILFNHRSSRKPAVVCAFGFM